MRYKSVERLKAVGDNTVIGASGEISDFIYIQKLLEELVYGFLANEFFILDVNLSYHFTCLFSSNSTEDFTEDDGHKLSTPEIHSYLNRVLYNRRNNFDPLWNSVVIGGFKNGKPYLGVVGLTSLRQCPFFHYFVSILTNISLLSIFPSIMRRPQ